ncbi:MAG TPA: ABC transporter ATP-binding protein [Gemmatimonadales bacterium]|nr:ABC transporter ATP-binding protein [Gemmatimonadales bacterium]
MELNGPALRFDDVHFRYRAASAEAVAGVSLAVMPGETVALLGPNGAGKTTITRLAMALRHPTAGEVRSAGRSTTGLAPEQLADAVGYLFQQPESQLSERSVAAEVSFGPRQLGWSEARIAEATAAVLDRLELGPHAERHPYDLPVPSRRVVALAAALVTAPALLLLDEPTAGLDRGTARLVHGVLRSEARRGAAILAVSHDPEFVAEVLGRAVVLAGGSIVDDGPVTEVLARGGGDRLPLPAYAEAVRRIGLSPAGPSLDDAAAALSAHCRGSG